MIEKIVNVKVTEDGFDDLAKKTSHLKDNIDDLGGSNKSLAGAFSESSNAILENGGAMGLLNDLTGGYAMMVKDAVEASALFIVKKRADAVATAAQTTATVTQNTATQQGILAKIKDIATTVSSSVAKGASTVATNLATAAQWLWNTAVMANPLVAFVVAIVAAGVAIYKLTSYLMANAEANYASSLATARMIKELQAQSIAAERSLRALKENAEQNYAMAKANGASTAELRKMKKEAMEAEIALNKKNVTIARATFLQEANNLAIAKSNDLSDEEIKKKEDLVKATYKEFQEQNNLLDKSYKGRAQMNKDFLVEIATENKSANDKAIAEAEKRREKEKADAEKRKQERIKAGEDAKKVEEDRLKSIAELEKKYKLEIEDLQDTTDQDKLERQKERALAEIDLITKTEEEKLQLRKSVNEKFAILNKELWDKEQADKLAFLEKFKEAEKEFQDAKTEEEVVAIEEKKANDLAIEEEEQVAKAEKLGANEAEILSIKKYYDDQDKANKEASTEAKNKLAEIETQVRMQQVEAVGAVLEKGSEMVGKHTAIGKTMAIASATIDMYKGIMATWGAASMGNPVVDMAIKIASTAIIAAQGVMNIKKILAVKVPASGGASGGGGAPSAPPAPPQFNIVGQSGTNQLAQSIGAQQQRPVQAFVVGNEVTSQQALERNRQNTATFNN